MNGAYGRRTYSGGKFAESLAKLGKQASTALQNVDWEQVSDTVQTFQSGGSGAGSYPLPNPPVSNDLPVQQAYPEWAPWAAVGGIVIIALVLIKR